MEAQVVTTQPIFEFKQSGLDANNKVVGRFLASGFIPKFVEDLEARGIQLPKGMFRQWGDRDVGPCLLFKL